MLKDILKAQDLKSRRAVAERLYTLDANSNRHWVKGQVGKYAWDSNPWVWAIGIERIER